MLRLDRGFSEEKSQCFTFRVPEADVSRLSEGKSANTAEATTGKFPVCIDHPEQSNIHMIFWGAVAPVFNLLVNHSSSLILSFIRIRHSCVRTRFIPVACSIHRTKTTAGTSYMMNEAI